MNYLAHAYLSFDHEEILVGNMISDFVKGRKQFDYPKQIHKGIILHRAIDEFTDQHKATKQAKQFFKPVVGLYSGAFVDVAYDYFLANDHHVFTESTLYDFSQRVYATLDMNKEYFPEIFSHMFPYMKRQNWLYGYRFTVGIHQSFGGLVRRTKYLQDASAAIQVFEQSKEQLKYCYDNFWKDMQPFAFLRMKELLLL